MNCDFFSVGNSGCCWHVGGTSIAAAYKAFSSEKFKGDVGVYIGLDHVNITLDAVPQWEDIVGKSSNQSRLVFIDVHFNERCARALLGHRRENIVFANDHVWTERRCSRCFSTDRTCSRKGSHKLPTSRELDSRNANEHIWIGRERKANAKARAVSRILCIIHPSRQSSGYEVH